MMLLLQRMKKNLLKRSQITTRLAMKERLERSIIMKTVYIVVEIGFS